MLIFLRVIITLLYVAIASNATADTPPNNLPRFVSLKNQEVNLRTGPGYRYPIKWVYKKRYMPVEITEERGTWRKIRDVDGEEGWAHSTQLTGKRTGLPRKSITAQRFPANDAPPAFRTDKGVLLYVHSCDKEWCHISCESHQGWVKKKEIWGVYPEETIEE